MLIVKYTSWIVAGRSGVQIPVWATDVSILQIVQTSSGAHPASYSMRTGASHFHLLPKIRLSGAIPLLHHVHRLHLNLFTLKHRYTRTQFNITTTHRHHPHKPDDGTVMPKHVVLLF